MNQQFRCPLCRGAELSPTKYSFARGNYVRCSSCGLLSLFPLPEATMLSELYSRGYYSAEESVGYQGYERLRRARSLSFKRLAKQIARRFPGGRVLDVGCAFGYFVAACLSEGLDAYGIDISPDAVRSADKSIRWRLHTARVADYAVAHPGAFDVLFVAETLEHIPDPQEFVAAVAGLLKLEGLFYCLTPNEQSTLARVSGRRWVSLKPPEHVILYNPATLRAALAPWFRIVCIRPSFQYYPLELIAARLRTLWRPLSLGAELLLALHVRRPVRIPDGQMLCVAERLDPH